MNNRVRSTEDEEQRDERRVREGLEEEGGEPFGVARVKLLR